MKGKGEGWGRGGWGKGKEGGEGGGERGRRGERGVKGDGVNVTRCQFLFAILA